ncbi:metal-dependent hydrolase [Myroides sp. 1354]|uniref:metal-dependent hydrolase n=1 Tax=unclassified Myroides TaxID=2642485 RepID=UPI00257619C7|nr:MULTISPECIES: metal-dependent hydrolase [unclassified Myroides]MDM1046000.1 metal-dependent hydrolase [Myroides sp. R163-1]MDM1055850.1 metal-dependent hydrolase [Myroides sp. 1354]MDM1070031.1 metal-dependent hydrolase [Myroides sp. 1372]
MDSLTQIVLGGAVGNALLGEKLKNKAVLYGAIAGTIPDLDVLAIFFTDPISALEFHRGFTHSILFAILGAFLFGFLLYWFEKKKGVTYEEGVWLFFWGFFTHAALDVFTTWGTRVLWPLDYSFAFKSIFVIDPLYTLPFLFFLLRSMREKTNMKRRLYLNRLGLYVSSAYLGLTLLLKAVAFYSFTGALDKQHIAYNAMSVKPTIMNTILWTAIVETKDDFLIGEYSFFGSNPIEFKKYPKNREVIGSLEKHYLIHRLVRLSEGYYTFSEVNNEIYFNDLRFGVLKEEGEEVQFAFSYKFFIDEKGELGVKEVKKDKRDGVKLLKSIGRKIFGLKED